MMVMAQLLAAAGKVIIASNFMTAFILGGALSSLFGAINKLQLMVHLLLVNVQIPANASVFFGIILQLVTYNFIEIDD